MSARERNTPAMTTESYYDRKHQVLPTGQAVFRNQTDAANEEYVKAVLEEAWGYRLHPYPNLHGIDWYAEQDNKLVAHIELKSRSKPMADFRYAWLNMRKYITLMLSETMTGVPSIFVCKWADGAVKWIRVNDIDPRESIKIAGTRHIVKSSSDIEPIIQIPIEEMHGVA